VPAHVSSPLAFERVRELLQARHRRQPADVERGYLDLLGDDDPTGRLPGQRLMASRALPLIYERLWRPLGGRILMGAMGPAMRDERRIALEMLGLCPGDFVLDVGCGPGNFTRSFADEVGAGLAVGIDASRTMLERAVAETTADNVAYVRGDASAVPFRDASFDAVCCFAALYLIEQPMLAVAEIARVLKPGGRVALLSSVSRGPVPVPVANIAVRGLTGVRMFGRDELTRELRRHGIVDVGQRIAGLGQFVSGRKPEGP
jgi:SAM-dependent methyltransferase